MRLHKQAKLALLKIFFCNYTKTEVQSDQVSLQQSEVTKGVSAVLMSMGSLFHQMELPRVTEKFLLAR